LLATGDKQLVQVDTDLCWGAKYSENTPGHAVGENNAGKVLMRVRETVRKM